MAQKTISQQPLFYSNPSRPAGMFPRLPSPESPKRRKLAKRAEEYIRWLRAGKRPPACLKREAQAFGKGAWPEVAREIVVGILQQQLRYPPAVEAILGKPYQKAKMALSEGKRSSTLTPAQARRMMKRLVMLCIVMAQPMPPGSW